MKTRTPYWTRGSSKPHSFRQEDALYYLERALLELPKSKQRQLWLDGALLAYWFAVRFPAYEDRRSGEKRHDDTDALKLMDELVATTGDTRPNRLARLVVEAGKVDLKGAQATSVVRRLAKSWKLTRVD